MDIYGRSIEVLGFSIDVPGMFFFALTFGDLVEKNGESPAKRGKP